jgi:hypothetical protein
MYLWAVHTMDWVHRVVYFSLLGVSGVTEKDQTL